MSNTYAGIETMVNLTEKTDPDCFRRVTNAELPFDGSQIAEKTGIESRLIADPKQTIVSLSCRAIEQVLSRSRTDRRDIGGLVLATCYPGDKKEMANRIAEQMGIRGSAHGIDRACAGGIAATELANEMSLSTGRPILGIATEKLSDMVNWAPPGNMIEGWMHRNDKHAVGKGAKIFGDASAAFLIKPPGYSYNFEILDATAYSIPNQFDKIVLVPVEHSKDIQGNVREGITGCINMPGKAGAELMKLGPDVMISGMQSMIHRAVERGLLEKWRTPEHAVCHQANGMMINSFADKFRMMAAAESGTDPSDIQTTVWNRIADKGNISAASIWYVLPDVLEASQENDLIAVSAVGAGSPDFRRDKLEAAAMLLRRVTR